MKRVVVVGGGISGLTAAYALKGRARVTLLEPGELGGTIRTAREQGFVIEGGPDALVAAKPEGAQLCRELGLEDQLIPSKARRVFVYSEGRLHELPEGMFLTVPTKILPMLKSRLVSWPGKIRMGLDLVMPRGSGGDESLGAFVRRRFGREALAKIAEPLMGGIFVADADSLGLQATFPRFLEMERRHRSLIRAMRQVPVSGQSPFLTLRTGLGTLVERLVAALDAEILRRRAVRVEPGFRVVLDDRTLEADAVVVATPAPAAARLLSCPALARIPYVSSATVSLGYRGVTVPEGSGFLLPRAEGRRIHACSFTSWKFEGRAPEGHTLLRCFLVGEHADPVATARAELAEILGIRAEPVITKVFTWPSTNPIYEVGHLDRVAAIEAGLPPGLFLTGAGYRGIGIAGCIADARRVAALIHGQG